MNRRLDSDTDAIVIGFVDLVDFTKTTRRLPDDQLAELAPLVVPDSSDLRGACEVLALAPGDRRERARRAAIRLSGRAG